MKNLQLTSACVLAALCAHAVDSRAANPIVQTVYTADPAPMVYQDRVYLYTGHDEDSATSWYTMNDWRVFSSADMVNWTDHGSPMSYHTFSWAKGDAWAAQPVPKGGKFYYFAPVTASATNGMAIGVGVSDSPIGPFKDAIGKPLISGGPCENIDPTPFIDDDGQAYLFWGRTAPCYVKLNADLISYQGSITRITPTVASFGAAAGSFPSQYEEGPWFFKRNGNYYLAYAANDIPEALSYSMSSSPTGPFTYKGVIMAPSGASFTNQIGTVDFKGKSYLFYHNGALPGGGGYHRSVAVEEFKYNSDGTFPSVKMTSAGPSAVANLNPYERVEAETIAWETGVETEVCTDGGMDVTAISNGDSIKVKSVDFGTGATSLSVRVASAGSGGNIEVRLDSASGALIVSCGVSGTGGAQTWKTQVCPLSAAAMGVHDLFFKFTGGSGNLFNFDWWQFAGSGPATGTGGASGSGGAAGSSSGGGASGGSSSGGSSGGRGSSGGGAGGAMNSSGGVAGAPELGGSSGNATAGGAITNGAGGSNTAGGAVSANGGASAGSVGSGGTSASGGNAPRGGSASGLGGANLSASMAGTNSGSTSDASGCSCRTSPQPSNGASIASLLLLGSLLRRARSRRRARSGSVLRAL